MPANSVTGFIGSCLVPHTAARSSSCARRRQSRPAAAHTGFSRSGACPEHVEPLLKFVAGVGGDEIDDDGYGVRINGARWPMSAPQHVDDLAALKTTSWDATPRLRRCDDNLDAASE
jgi:hypothetical protein